MGNNSLIYIVLFIVFLLSISFKTDQSNKFKILAKRIKGIGIASDMDFPTVNIEFDQKYNINCGVYRVNTSYNIGYMYVDCDNFKEIHFINLREEIEVNDIIEIYDIVELDKDTYKISKNGILGTYYNGCKHCLSK